MKNLKLFGYVLVTVLFLGLYSCGGGAKTEVKVVVEDTTVVEPADESATEVTDTVQVEEPEVMEAE